MQLSLSVESIWRFFILKFNLKYQGGDWWEDPASRKSIPISQVQRDGQVYLSPHFLMGSPFI
jgi:hypothetical protein